MKNAIFIILTSLALTAYPALLEGEEYKSGRPSQWVREIAVPDYVPRESEISNGEYYLLSDIQVNGETGEYYNHYALQLTNSTGLENNSQVSIDFNPTIEELVIHKIAIVREGKESDRLANAMTSVIQQEKDLKKLMYNGTRSFYAILSDVRVGDILDVAYTIRDKKELFSRLNDRYYLEWGVPVHRVYRRVIADGGLPLHWRTNREIPAPVKGEREGEYIWDLNDSREVDYEDNVPMWYDASNYLEISQYDDWEQVRKEIMDLYAPLDLSEDQTDKILSQYSLTGETDRKKIAARLLDAVQEDIRYMGVEIGRGSYIPGEPFDVFNRRFGDCKDKSLLLSRLLQHNGIEAWPVLVHNSTGKDLINVLPGPYQFNHVIVKTVINGTVYWLDPTITYQEGDLDSISTPLYGYGLVLSPRSAGLEKIEPGFSGTNMRIRESFTLPDQMDGAGDYLISTEYYDEDADSMRSWLANTSASDVAENLLDFLKDYYSGIKATEDFTYSDDRSANVLILKEHYSIPGIWKYFSDENKYQFTYSPYEIYNYTDVPDKDSRTMPYYLRHPYKLEQNVSIKLPDKWNIHTKKEKIETGQFLFRRSVAYKNDLLNIDYAYESKQDSVMPAEMEEYRQALEDLEKGIDYKIYRTPRIKKEQDRKDYYVALILIGVLVFVLFRILKIQKH